MTRGNDIFRFLKKSGGVLLLSAIVFCGCSDKPKGTLSERKMVKLMADLQLAEAYSNTVGLSHYGATDSREEIGKGVLAAHDVSQEQLDSTLSWYGRNIDDYTNLYEKVDKEIMSRRKKIMREGSQKEINSADMLWPYQSHGVLSTLGNSDAWILSLESPSLERGDILEWSLRLSETTQLNGVLGVEYTDGTSDANSQMLTGSRRKYEIQLQTDTGKTVRRIYGTLRLRESDQKPIYADSIMLRKMPFDSLEYAKHRSLRHYGAPARIKPKVEKKDTIAKDTVKMFKKMELDNDLRPIKNDEKVKSTTNEDKPRMARQHKPFKENGERARRR